MFALKPDKVKNSSNKKNASSKKNYTLDTKHTEMIDKFQTEVKKLEQYRADLSDFQSEHDRLVNKDKKDMTVEDYNRLKDLKDGMKGLKKRVAAIENNKDYHKYILNTSNVLFSYYQSRDNVSQMDADDPANNSDEDNKTTNAENIFAYLTTGGNNEKKETPIQKESKKRSSVSGSDRASLLNKFMIINDKNYVRSKNKKRINDKCKNCSAEVTVMATEGKAVCEKCGVEEDVIINSDKPSFREPPSELTYFAYKRINHFNETLAQIQAKESTDIPEEIFDKIRNELSRERITNMKKLTKKIIKKYLNRLGYNKYYEHAPYIIQKLSGKQLNIPRELEEQAKLMFRMAEEQFPKIKPPDRKNFLNYNYMHYKIFEMLGYHDIKRNFPLLKGKQKLHLQDQMLHDIAEILKKKFPAGNVWENFEYTDDY